MRDLVNIGRDQYLYVDADQVIAILPDNGKKFGSIVVVQGINNPIATGVDPDDVVIRLRNGDAE